MKAIKYNNKTIKIPAGFEDLDFNSMWNGAGPLETQTVTNQLSGQSCQLPNFAAAVYESVMGCNHIAEAYDRKHGIGTSPDWEIVRMGLDWFRRHFAKEYMVLLD